MAVSNPAAITPPLWNKVVYNDSQRSDTTSVSQLAMREPDKVSKTLVKIGARLNDASKFAISALTEGAGRIETIEKDEYEYPVQIEPNTTRAIAVTPANTDSVGKGHEYFTLTFPDKWFIMSYTCQTPSGRHARIMAEPRQNGSNWDYTFQLTSPDPNEFLPVSDVTAGAVWVQMFAAVGIDWSRGNASNSYGATKLKHKLTTLRKSYQMAGNMKQYVMEFNVPNKEGGYTKMWMEYEEWLRWKEWKEEQEYANLYAKRNYNDQGITHMKDENGQPIFISPGLFEQVTNKDTYSELTLKKFNSIINEIDSMQNTNKAESYNIDVYTGNGGFEDFDKMIKDNLVGFTAFNDGVFVSGTGNKLQYQGYFTRYQHISGKIINLVKVPMFDYGNIAKGAPRHPRTGYSLESHRFLVLDTGVYDGVANLAQVHKKGREMLRWAVSGSTIPTGFTGNDNRANDIDGCAVHFLKQGGVFLKNWTTSFDLQCVAA